MTLRDLILERMAGTNPLPDLDRIDDADLASMTSLLEDRMSAPSTGHAGDRLASEPPRRLRFVMRPAVVLVSAFIVVLGIIGALALLRIDGDDVVDTPPPTVETTLATTTTATTTTEPTTEVDATPAPGTSAPTEVAAFQWSRVPHDDAVFGGEDVGDAGWTNARMSDATTGHGVIVAVGWQSGVLGPDNAFVDRAAAWYSEDGSTWRRATGDGAFAFGEFPWPDGGVHLRTVTATRTGFVAVGNEMEYPGIVGGAVWASSDGRSWARVTDPAGVFGSPGESVEIRDFATIGDTVIAVGRRSLAAAAWRSDDGGATWSEVPHDPAVFGARTTADDDHDGLGDGLQSIDTITPEGSGFVAAGITEVGPDRTGPGAGEFDALVWRIDAAGTWTLLPDATGDLGGSGSQIIREIVILPDRYVAVGTEWLGDPGDPSPRAAAWVSSDLSSWRRVAHDEVFGTDIIEVTIHDATVAHGVIVAVGFVEDDAMRALVLTSADGENWTGVDDAAFSEGTWLQTVVAAQDGIVLGGGDNPTPDWTEARAAVWLGTPGDGG